MQAMFFTTIAGLQLIFVIAYIRNGPLPTGFLKGGEYYQVFADRLGFIPDLSAVDLLFNEGPNAISFLK